MILAMNDDNAPSLTCVIPVSKMSNQLSYLSQTLTQCFANKVYVILIHDIQDSTTGEQIVALHGFKQLSKAGMIRYLEGSFKGPGPSRNVGLSAVNTEWVAFWDADDSPVVEKVLQLVSSAEKADALSAFGNFEEIDFNSGVKLHANINQKNSNVAFAVGMNPGLWRWVFRTNYIREHRFPNILMGEDQLFLIEISPFSHNIYADQNIVYKYSKNRVGQLTSSRVAINEISSAITLFGQIHTSQENSKAKTFASTIIWKLVLTKYKNAHRCLPNLNEIWNMITSNQGKQVGFISLISGLIRILIWKK